MVSELKHLLGRLLAVPVDTHLARDLTQGKHVRCRRELHVHDVLVQVDVRRLVHQGRRLHVLRHRVEKLTRL